MGQLATVLLQVPHKHASLEPTRSTTEFAEFDAVCATLMTATSTTRRLFFSRRICLGDSEHLCPRILQPHLARNQADQRAAKQHPETQPDTRDQGEYERLNHGALVIRRHASEIQIQILV